MWPDDPFLEVPDSDQSISDEEELRYDYPSAGAPVASALDKQGRPRLMSQLELLQELHEVDQRREISSGEKNAGFSSGDEVEMPDFHDEVTCQRSRGFISNPLRQAVTCRSYKVFSDDEVLSDDEKGINAVTNSVISRAGVRKMDLYDIGKGKQIAASAVSKAADYSSKEHLCKGGGGKTKQRAKFQFLSHKNAFPRPFIPEEAHRKSSRSQLLPKGPDTLVYNDLVTGSTNWETYSSRKDGMVSELMPTKYSIAELLDGLQENNRSPYRTSEMCGAVSKYMVQIKSDEEPCDSVHEGSSNDDEVIVTESEKRTMVDQFVEVLGGRDGGASDVLASSNQSSLGLHGRLLRVVQWEKDRDADFLKKLHNEARLGGDEARCINVKILSRTFEGKLIVCSCCICKNNESSLQVENSQDSSSESTKMIIFSCRVCSDVEIDVGNSVLIHPPWNEVQVSGCGAVLLATYFTHSLPSLAWPA